MILNRRIRGALFAAALVLAAALAVVALRAAYPRADSVGLDSTPAAAPAPGVVAGQPDPVAAEEPTEPRPSPAAPAIAVQPSAPQGHAATEAPKADTALLHSPDHGTRDKVVNRGVACEEYYEQQLAPRYARTFLGLRATGAGGHASTRRATAETRRDEEPARRSPVRIMTLGESIW